MRRAMIHAKRQRRGAAVVEFAVCLPLLMLIILGSIEATHGIFLKQGLSAAAYESIREAVNFNSTTASARQKANNVIAARQIKSSDVTFTPSNIAGLPKGTKVTVEVSALMSANSPFIGKVFNDRVIRVRSVMLKE